MGIEGNAISVGRELVREIMLGMLGVVGRYGTRGDRRGELGRLMAGGMGFIELGG